MTTQNVKELVEGNKPSVIKIVDESVKNEIVIFKGCYGEAENCLFCNGCRVAYAEEVAKARIEQGEGADISTSHGWTREGLIYLPREHDVFLTKNPPRLGKSWQCDEQSVMRYQLEGSLVSAVKVRNTSIPTNRFGEEELTRYLFGKNAQEYGNFIKEAGIGQMHIDLMRHYLRPEKPFATLLEFGAVLDPNAVPLFQNHSSWIFGESKPDYFLEGKTFGVPLPNRNLIAHLNQNYLGFIEE